MMEALLKRELSTVKLVSLGSCSGGCISNAHSYEIDNGRVFVKYNTDEKGKLMFDGENASLEALLATNTVQVPAPMKVFRGPGDRGWVFVMEHINDIIGLRKHQAMLGEQLARLHLHNSELKGTSNFGYLEKFGFPCTTCCGFIPMPNDWTQSWTEFYITKRLQPQIDLIQKEYRDREVKELWETLKTKITGFFSEIQVFPSLLHGDLWSGNVGEIREGPVIYDPASFYGHHEFDLSITSMFGGFTNHFYDSYHQIIPKAAGFESRHKLYILFHYLNHWNHFGTGYRSQSISTMRELSR